MVAGITSLEIRVSIMTTMMMMMLIDDGAASIGHWKG